VNGFLPGGSGTTVRNNTEITQNNTPNSNKIQHTKLHQQQRPHYHTVKGSCHCIGVTQRKSSHCIGESGIRSASHCSERKENFGRTVTTRNSIMLFHKVHEQAGVAVNLQTYNPKENSRILPKMRHIFQVHHSLSSSHSTLYSPSYWQCR
jgi:hypothetical protein